MRTKQYRCVVSVPVEYTIEARDRDAAMARALSLTRTGAPRIELRDGTSFYPVKLASEEVRGR